MARLIAAYKQVRNDVTSATAIRSGIPGGIVETYQKIDTTTGRGVLVIFANGVGKPYGPDQPMTAEVVTDSAVARSVVTTAGVAVRFDTEGRVIVRAQFEETGSAIVFFGAAE